jgi:uncharacterized protein (DUF1800 family)
MFKTATTSSTLAASALLAGCLGGGETDTRSSGQPAEASSASRFLGQASFGANSAEIEKVQAIGPAAWIEEQFGLPQSLHREYIDWRTSVIAPMGFGVVPNDFIESFWRQAVSGRDQLRQRAAFALSQIFVVSFADNTVLEMARGVASYYDMLGKNAFGNFRQLLEDVTLHPVMGTYLSSLRNQKESSVRVPDENFAREVMQLFTIGLYELNSDATLKRDAQSAPIETYRSSDVAGLARVFTGWSWYAGPEGSVRTREAFLGTAAHPDRDWRPMQAYPDFHSVSTKRFLGVEIPSQSAPDPEASLKTALDTLFAHPNVGPFIGRQLIQRLVTSNPSPAYVARVANAFADNGKGVRGDMKAVWRAVLLDPDARAEPTGATGGKLREPVLRLANLFRAFDSSSRSGRFTGIDNTDDTATRLGQTPMRAPSVFNFFRPAYAPSGSQVERLGLVAPEMQLVHDVSVAGYLNYLQEWLGDAPLRDVQLDFRRASQLAYDPDKLTTHLSLLIAAGDLPASLHPVIASAVADRAVPTPLIDATGAVQNQAEITLALRDRVRIAAMLIMASPDYLVQR